MPYDLLNLMQLTDIINKTYIECHVIVIANSRSSAQTNDCTVYSSTLLFTSQNCLKIMLRLSVNYCVAGLAVEWATDVRNKNPLPPGDRVPECVYYENHTQGTIKTLQK